MTKEEAKKLVLENKKVKLEFIPERYNKEYTRIDPKHIGKSHYDKCTISWGLPLSREHQGYFPFLSIEEQKAFEVLLSRKDDELSFYNFGKPGNFWITKNSIVDIDKEGTTFNLNDPIQNLKYRITKVQPIVAPSWEERTMNMEYRWAFKDLDHVTRANADFAKLKRKATLELDKIDRKKQLEVLLALGVQYPNNVSEEWLINKFDDIIQTKETRAKNPSVKDLLRVLADEETGDKAFMNKCIKNKLFEYKAPGKYMYDGEIVVQSGGKQGLLAFLKDSENKTFVAGIKERLKNIESE